ncbi:MAG TPA: hypothetical protein VKZ43_04645 [Trueperaceae bacterium]|nr:hypothetical protein [Trueperaceae bacterium]
MIALLLTGAVVLLTVSMLLAPVETLGWWAGWFGEGLDQPGDDDVADYQIVRGDKQPRLYIVYLDGIAKAAHRNYEDVQGLLDGLDARLPDAVILGDFMPYSVSNVGLTQDRLLARFWQRMLALKLEGRRPLLAFSINLRNLLQVLVAADRRYGPVYGRGEAQVILNSLLRSGYDTETHPPIVIIGYSGGVQMGLVAAPFLKRALGTDITMISLAGVMASDPGLGYLEHLYHLEGSSDAVPSYGRVLFPGRWRVWWGSHWNKLRRWERLTLIDMGPMKHNGAGGYLDDEQFIDGKDHRGITTATIAALVEDIGTKHLERTSGLAA